MLHLQTHSNLFWRKRNKIWRHLWQFGGNHWWENIIWEHGVCCKKCSLNTDMYRTENRLRIFSNRVVSSLLSLSVSLSVSPARIPCKLKLSIEPASLSLLFGFHTCFRMLFLHGIRARGLRTSATGTAWRKNWRRRTGRTMDRSMASSLPVEKLDRTILLHYSHLSSALH